jgi:CBS domain-containing protein
LRIEARAFPSGPSVMDEMATTAFFIGTLHGALQELDDPQHLIEFDRVRESFLACARQGLDAHVLWLDGVTYPVTQLIQDILLPLAYRGLEQAGLSSQEQQRYLGIIEQRVRQRRTGADWLLDAYETLKSLPPPQRAHRAVLAMQEAQRSEKSIVDWNPLTLQDKDPASLFGMSMRLESLMSTELSTIRANDSVELAMSLLRWKQVRHLPVEDDMGSLVGMLDEGILLSSYATNTSPTAAVSTIMAPITTSACASTTLQEALQLVRLHQTSILPVLEGKELIGIVTERDLLRASEKVIHALAKTEQPATHEPSL